MGGEINLGNIKHINITKFKDNEYQMSFELDDGYFHLVNIKDLENLLSKSLENIFDWEQSRKTIETLPFEL